MLADSPGIEGDTSKGDSWRRKRASARTTRTPGSAPSEARPGPAGEAAQARRQAAAPDVVEAALAAFAHEVRTPLTGILAISDLLATSDLGERERRWVDTIKAGAEHLASLATLFVDAARSRQRAGRTLRQDLFDLRALARSAGDSLAGRAAAKGLQAAGRDLREACRRSWSAIRSACAPRWRT